METKIIEEYQELIDKLNKITSYSTDYNGDVIGEVKRSIKMLGTRPVLPENVEHFRSITNDMTKTYIQKNHDYGNSFEQSLDKFGIIAGVVRIGDKMNRIESLTTKEAKVKEESIKDTFLDMASYCIMTVMWLNKQSE